MPIEEEIWRRMSKIAPQIAFLPYEKKKEMKKAIFETINQYLHQQVVMMS